jgi:hypothetical protein
MQTTTTDSKHVPDYAKVKEILDIDFKDKNCGWEPIKTPEGIKAYKKSNDPLPWVWMKTTFEDVDLDALFKMQYQMDLRKLWDKNIVKDQIIEEVNDTEDVQYLEMKLPFPLSNRIVLQHRAYVNNKDHPELVKKYNLYKKEQKYYMIHSKSIERADVQDPKGSVRMEIVFTGGILEEDPSNPRNVHVTIISCALPGGYVPMKLVTMGISQMPQMTFDPIKKAYKEHKDAIKQKVGKV